MKSLRFFYIPNENTPGDQVGPHKAFRLLLQQGVFSALTSYSFLVERKRFGSHHEALADLLRAIAEFAPDVVYWQHLNQTYPVDREFLRRIKGVASKPKLVWHDPDPYGRLVKPIDAVMRNVIAECDLAVVKGLGYFADMVRFIGARRLLYAMESYDDERFGTEWEPSQSRDFDVVMVANLTTLKRIPGLYMPGGRSRKQLAERLHRLHGTRFAVFGGGRGWANTPYCRGSINFDQQEKILRSAWISVNWSQFDTIPMYFSDRLPISLASGIPHVTNYQRGFEHILGQPPGVYFVHSPAEATDVADMLLSLPRARLIEIGIEGALFARKHLNAVVVYRDIVFAIRERLFEKSDE